MAIKLSNRAKVIIAGVLILIAIILILIFLPRPKETPTPSPTVSQPTPSLPTTETQPTVQPVKEPKDADIPEATAETVAKIFIERFGSYSVESNLQNVEDVLPLATDRYQAELIAFIENSRANPPADSYYGVTSRVISIESVFSSESAVTIKATVQKEESVGSVLSSSIRYQEIVLEMVKVEGEWKVDQSDLAVIMENAIRSSVHWFTEAFFPEFCVSCGREGSIFCSVCMAGWIPAPYLLDCPSCQRPGMMGKLCRRCQRSIPISHLLTIGPYRDPVLKTLVKDWKFFGSQASFKTLRQIIERYLSNYPEMVRTVDAVTHVPLHYRRKNERGFDQAEWLAKLISEQIGAPFLPILRRHRYTTQQSSTDRSMREFLEFDNAFTYIGGEDPPTSVLLVDDVWTTGATMGAAARVLANAGVQEIVGFAVARG